MTIANALQLEAARATPVLSRFNYDAMPSFVAEQMLIHYFTLWPWPTFDLNHLQPIACDKVKRCTKYERNRAIRGGVIAVSVFDRMTLNIALRVALSSGIIFTKFDLEKLIRAWIIAFLMLIRYVTLVPWPLTGWPWKVVHQVSRDQSMYEIWAKSSNPGLNYW